LPDEPLFDNSTSTNVLLADNTVGAAKIMAMWTMAENGLDDSPDEFAQFMPSLKFAVDKNYQICAVVGGDSANSLSAVYGQAFYPQDAVFAANSAKNHLGGGQATAPHCAMDKLSWKQGYDLFCGQIQTNNSNLPTLAKNDGGIPYNYNVLCGANGELMKDNVGVYCCDQALSYDDPAGDYNAIVIAEDSAGGVGDSLNNKFTYIAQAAIEVNFSKISYGEVNPNVEAVAQDYQGLNLQKLTSAVIRNIGNTRAQITVWQDDMGVGKTGDSWNISYKVKINDSDWLSYQPYESVALPQTLDLGQSGNVDFAVQVNQFPPSSDTVDYQGQMKIEAVQKGN